MAFKECCIEGHVYVPHVICNGQVLPDSSGIDMIDSSPGVCGRVRCSSPGWRLWLCHVFEDTTRWGALTHRSSTFIWTIQQVPCRTPLRSWFESTVVLCPLQRAGGLDSDTSVRTELENKNKKQGKWSRQCAKSNVNIHSLYGCKAACACRCVHMCRAHTQVPKS